MKVRPTVRATEIWQPALRLLGAIAVDSGGYVATQQPPTPMMLEWRDGRKR